MMKETADLSTTSTHPYAGSLFGHLYTLFLFTKSDFKTTITPISLFAMAVSPKLQLARIPQVIFWLWLHVLQCDVSNQTTHPEEDEVNKSDRPIPSGRMTLRQALILRWLLVPVCWIYSLWYSTQLMWTSVVLTVLTFIYNEQAAASHWAMKNLLNGFGLCTFEAGAALTIAPQYRNLQGSVLLAILMNFGIYVTTIHTQDFKDVQGDSLIGRHTLPIVRPDIARETVIVGMSFWSMALAWTWGLDGFTSAAFVLLAVFVGYRFMAFKETRDDQISFYWYNVWLSLAHISPAYFRYLA